MMLHQFRFERLFAWIVATVVLTEASSFADDDVETKLDNVDLNAIWKQTIEVNRGWLDPQPKDLTYRLISGSPDQPRLLESEVWVSGDKARWEIKQTEFQLKDAPPQLAYILIITPEQSKYLHGPAALLQEPLETRPLNNLRQGITWHTAMHELHQRGLPDDSKLVSDIASDGKRILILDLDLANRRSVVGLGLYHAFHGRSRRPIGRVKLTLQLPDHIPLREEWGGDHAVTVKYDPEFFKLGRGRAPRSIRYNSKSEDKKWVLQSRFQLVDDVWLLKDAQNIYDEETTRQMKVENVSTKPIDGARFELPK